VDAVTPEIHDGFRGVKGAWRMAMDGIQNAMDAGLRTGFRITITKDNWGLAVEMGVPRFCLYHLVPTGRGENIAAQDVTKAQRVEVLKCLYDKAIELKGKDIEILTTDSPMDGVYILERLKKEDPERASVRLQTSTIWATSIHVISPRTRPSEIFGSKPSTKSGIKIRASCCVGCAKRNRC